MSRPDWCPQDVWEAAVRLQDELYNWTDEGEAPQQDANNFARAILAERERCTAVVTNLPGMGDADCCGGFERCREDAIEAIKGATT